MFSRPYSPVREAVLSAARLIISHCSRCNLVLMSDTRLNRMCHDPADKIIADHGKYVLQVILTADVESPGSFLTPEDQMFKVL